MQIQLNTDSCKLVLSDGVKATLSQHRPNSAVRLDFEFNGAGHAIVRVPVSIKLTDSYVFQFAVAGQSPVNTLEIKLLDKSTDNVWWVNRPNFAFSSAKQVLINKTRHFSYAWGPNKEAMAEVAYIDLTLTASSGGKGTIYFSDLMFEERPSPGKSVAKPAVWASSSKKDGSNVLDGDDYSLWQSGLSERQGLVFTFPEVRELSAVLIDWGDHHARNYQLQIKGVRGSWKNIDTMIGAGGGRQYLRLPDCDIKAVRLVLRKSSAGKGYSVRSVRFMGLDYAPNANEFWRRIARDHPAGFFPRYFDNEQSFWTVVGVSGGRQEAIINEEGLLELGRQTASIEPFIHDGNELLTWKHGRHEQRLEDGYLPIAVVKRLHEKVALEVKAFAVGPRDDATLYARYKVINRTGVKQSGKLFLAIRQFQVNPPWQFLNTPGGHTPIHTFSHAGDTVYVGDNLKVRTLSRADAFGATSLATGDIVEHLNYGLLPEYGGLADTRGFGSGALMYSYELDGHSEVTFDISVPYSRHSTLQEVEDALAAVKREWHGKLDNVGIDIPAAAELNATIKSQLAYILVNRDGPAIQPGSRCYRRTWIRDGSLTSAALLQHGFVDEVREFIDWFAPYQYPSGKVPCCVDKRGSDPTPEHDSHGEFIYMVMEYYRYTGDKEFLSGIFLRIVKAVEYIEVLRQQNNSALAKADASLSNANALLGSSKQPLSDTSHLRGILPPSISHEGYSAHPAHSNWDNLFAMKGLDDAVSAALALGENEQVEKLGTIRDAFRQDLLASVKNSMRVHGIDYIPGAADLGDLDPTSTTIGLDPCEVFSALPQELEQTFARYWKFFTERRDDAIEWDAYTPYEWRSVGTFVRLGELEKAHAAIDYFMGHRRPRHWNHWAEVIYRDPLTPRFIGDAPHGWVGSDFLRSVRNLFVYERDNALVLAAGIKPDWLDKGVSISNLPTYFGKLSLTARRQSAESQSEGAVDGKNEGAVDRKNEGAGREVVYQLSGTVSCAMQLAVGTLGLTDLGSSSGASARESGGNYVGNCSGKVTVNGLPAEVQNGMVSIIALPARVVVSGV
ncbi:discoidin domain-containing protein [soil metagenome]